MSAFRIKAPALTLSLLATLTTGLQANSFQLMTEEEAANIRQTLASLQGAEREQFRKRIYAQLNAKATAAGYLIPPLPPVSAAPSQPVAPVVELAPAAPVAEVAPVAPPPPAPAPVAAAPAPQAEPQISAVKPEAAPQASEATPAPAQPAQPVNTMQPIEPPPPPLTEEQMDNAPDEEIIAALEAHRTAMQQYMADRRKQQTEMMDQLEQAKRAEMERQQAIYERQRQLYLQQREAHRRAMQQQIDQAINTLNPPMGAMPPR